VLFPVGLWYLSHGTFTFGAAKPVPVNPRNFRNYRRGDLIVSSAGIVTNLILAPLCALLFMAFGIAGDALPAAAGMLGTLQRMMVFGVLLNFILAVFNLVPLPPLDGSHLFYHLLPPAWGARYRQVGRFGFLVLLVTFMVPSLSGVWNVLLWPAEQASQLALSLVGGFALPGVIR
jgi:Zn-dependent protease